MTDDDAEEILITPPAAPVHEHTYGIAAPRHEAIDLDLARRMFAESRAEAYVNLEDIPVKKNAQERRKV
jgi:hypothetical protein